MNIDKFIKYILDKNKVIPPNDRKRKLISSTLTENAGFNWLLNITTKKHNCNCKSINKKILCNECDSLSCLKCNDVLTCDICFELFCENCCNYCDTCQKTICTNHDDDFVNCVFCEKLICEDCISLFCDSNNCSSYACEDCSEYFIECSDCDFLACQIAKKFDNL